MEGGFHLINIQKRLLIETALLIGFIVRILRFYTKHHSLTYLVSIHKNERIIQSCNAIPFRIHMVTPLRNNEQLKHLHENRVYIEIKYCFSQTDLLSVSRDGYSLNLRSMVGIDISLAVVLVSVYIGHELMRDRVCCLVLVISGHDKTIFSCISRPAVNHG